MVTVPARITRAPSQCPYVVLVAEVGRQRHGLEYARTQRPKKGGGLSEQGPSKAWSAPRERRRVYRANEALESRPSRSLEKR